jgi:hypothetical protein
MQQAATRYRDPAKAAGRPSAPRLRSALGRSTRAPWRSAVAAAAACYLSALGCNALWGVDELTFDGPAPTTTSTTTSTGAGGQGGQPAECSSPEDCPDAPDKCVVATCDAGSCGFDPTAEGAECAEAACTEGGAAGPRSCDGEGACAEPIVTPCAPYVCSDATCVTDCTAKGHADCAQGYYCGTGGGSQLQCLPTLIDGAICSEAAQCTSGQCVDGHCCAVACDGPCDSCATGSCVTDCAAKCQAEFGHLQGFLSCSASDESCRFYVQSSSSTCTALCGTGGCLNAEEDADNGCAPNALKTCFEQLNSGDGLCTCGHL